MLLAGRPEPNAVLDVIEKFKPTLFFGLPTLYNALLNHPRIDAADLSSIRLCLSAAEVLSQDIFDDWRRRFGHEILTSATDQPRFCTSTSRTQPTRRRSEPPANVCLGTKSD